MNLDILKGKSKAVKGQLKSWWGKLTDDDLKKISGDAEKLVGALQERYGWTKGRAKKEVENRLAKYQEQIEDEEGPILSRETRAPSPGRANRTSAPHSAKGGKARGFDKADEFGYREENYGAGETKGRREELTEGQARGYFSQEDYDKGQDSGRGPEELELGFSGPGSGLYSSSSRSSGYSHSQDWLGADEDMEEGKSFSRSPRKSGRIPNQRPKKTKNR